MDLCMTKTQYEEIRKRNVIFNQEVERCFNFVCALLEAEAKAVLKVWPSATAAVENLYLAAREVADLAWAVDSGGFNSADE